jgi:hypothetical protein
MGVKLAEKWLKILKNSNKYCKIEYLKNTQCKIKKDMQ